MSDRAEKLIERNRQLIAEAERFRKEIAKRQERWLAQRRDLESQQRMMSIWMHYQEPPQKLLHNTVASRAIGGHSQQLADHGGSERDGHHVPGHRP